MFFSFDLVFMDCESAMRVPAILELLQSSQIHLHNFVPCTGHLTDPCDNNFHGSDRARINATIAARQSFAPVSGDEKMEILRDAYQQATADAIRDHFRHCGLLGQEDPRAVASRLFDDHNRRAVMNYEKHHRVQLEEYLFRCHLRGQQVFSIPGRIGPWWDLIRQFEKN